MSSVVDAPDIVDFNPSEDKLNKSSDMTPIEFVELSTYVKPGLRLDIKEISDYWFRLNFWTKISSDKSDVIDEEYISFSQMIEVVEDDDGNWMIVDRTLT